LATEEGLLEPVSAGSAAERATSDGAWLAALLDAEAALDRAQGRSESLETEVKVHDLAVRATSAGNPVVALAAELGPEHHRGATSQDIMDTAAMLVADRTRTLIVADLERAVAAAAALARRHRDTVMAGRTLGMQAVPTTFGLRAAGWMVALDHCLKRLRALELPAQLGGAAGTMSALGDVSLLAAFAAETGLDEPVLPWHTLRGPVVELGSALALVTGALGKMATDVAVLSQTEIGEVAEPVAAGRGGSSAMPHKRNPVMAVLIRSAALQVPAQVQVLMSSQLAPLDRPAGEWHAEWQPLRTCLRLAGGAAAIGAELLEGLEVFPDRMRANMGSELVSEAVAGALAGSVGKERARELVASAIRSGRPLREALAEFSLDEAVFEPSPGCAGALVDRALKAFESCSGSASGEGA
jgi:3-carboxy-cis,cis-muconate cycloisomerase